MDAGAQLSRSYDLFSKIARLYYKRSKIACEEFNERVQKAYNHQVAELVAKPVAALLAKARRQIGVKSPW